MNDFIEVYDNAMDAKLCDAILHGFTCSDKVGRGITENNVDLARKNSYDLNISQHADWFDIQQAILRTTSPFLKKYLRKYLFTLVGAIQPTVTDSNTGSPVTLDRKNFQRHGEPVIDEIISSIYRFGELNVQRYIRGEGGYFHWHSELCPSKTDPTCDQLHRVLFFMYYLNSVNKGGTTEFFYQQKKVKPVQGRLVIAPASFTHTHRGNMPLSEDKYIVTSWILFNRAEVMYR